MKWNHLWLILCNLDCSNVVVLCVPFISLRYFKILRMKFSSEPRLSLYECVYVNDHRPPDCSPREEREFALITHYFYILPANFLRVYVLTRPRV